MNNIQFIEKLVELTENGTIKWKLLRTDLFRHSINGNVVEISRNSISLLPGATSYKFEVFNNSNRISSHTVEFFRRNGRLESRIIQLFEVVNRKYEEFLSSSYISIIDSSVGDRK